MNWRKRYLKPKSGDICKPKPKNKRLYKGYDDSHFINRFKTFTLKNIYNHNDNRYNNGDWWNIEEESGYGILSTDFEVIR